MDENIITNEAMNLTFPKSASVSGEAKEFIQRCLVYRKDERMDVLSACNDPYLAR